MIPIDRTLLKLIDTNSQINEKLNAVVIQELEWLRVGGKIRLDELEDIDERRAAAVEQGDNIGLRTIAKMLLSYPTGGELIF